MSLLSPIAKLILPTLNEHMITLDLEKATALIVLQIVHITSSTIFFKIGF